MVGITAYGAYLPRYRMKRKEILNSMSWINPALWSASSGEKTVANHDEDAITTAVAAIRNIPPQHFDSFLSYENKALYIASTSFPYSERLNSAIVSEATGCTEDCETADFSGSTRASTAALISALERASETKSFSAIVASGEVKKARPGSMDEIYTGDAGAALIVGSKNVLAAYCGSISISCDFPSETRDANQSFRRSWEERWIRDEGYKRLIPLGISKYFEKYGFSAQSFRYLIYPCRYGREYQVIAKKLGFQNEQLIPSLIENIGDTGSVHPLLMLCYALEHSSPEDQILLVGYGSGVDVIHFEITTEIEHYRPRFPFDDLLNRKKPITYEKMISFREILPVETGIRGEFQAETPMSLLWRNRKTILGLVGSKCRKCGLPQYPPQRTCVNPDCLAQDDMEPYPFSKQSARIFSYTGDNLAFSYDPPQIYGIIDFLSGGRMMLDFTDCDLDELEVGMEVELTFRRKYHDVHRGIHTYFWKACPKIKNSQSS